MVKLQKNKAFALLFAMFVSSIMLSIGLGISNIIYKELVLSGIGRESELSFYTAQTGLECAQYLNQTDPLVFPGVGEDGRLDSTRDMCVGAKIDPDPVTGTSYYVSTQATDGNSKTTTFQIRVQNSGAPDMCASVLVEKRTDNYINIESRGYNTCDYNNPRRVERSLKMVTYVKPPVAP